MNQYQPIHRLFLSIAFAVALAVGACARGDKPGGLEAAGSDTTVYRAAVAQADTLARFKALEAFLADFPQSSFRGSTYRRLYDLKKQKNAEDAATFLRRALETEKGAAARGALYYALFEHTREHAPGETEALIRTILAEQAPLPADLYNSIAWDLAEAGEHLDRAREVADRAVAGAPDDATKGSFIDTQGWVCFKNGDYARAVELFERARALTPEPMEEIELHLAKSYQAVGKKAEANDIYLALLLTQEDPEMRETVAQLSRDLGRSPEKVFRDLDRRREAGAKPAPDVTLKDYFGKEVRLADLKGSIVLVNFWHPT